VSLGLTGRERPAGDEDLDREEERERELVRDRPEQHRRHGRSRAVEDDEDLAQSRLMALHDERRDPARQSDGEVFVEPPGLHEGERDSAERKCRGAEEIEDEREDHEDPQECSQTVSPSGR
jgi:hypothetical protein